MATIGQIESRPLLRALALIELVVWLGALSSHASLTAAAAEDPEESRLGLEINLAAGPEGPSKRLFEARYQLVLERRVLKILDEDSARDLTAIRVVTSPTIVRESASAVNAVSVRLYATYSDKAEKQLGTYMVRDGESVRPAELTTLGIEPFEIRGVRAVPTVIKPSDKPLVTNSTQSLEVVRLERTFARYDVVLKNGYDKNVINFAIAFSEGFTYRSILDSAQPSAMAPGTIAKFNIGSGGSMDQEIRVAAVILADGTADGDPKIYAHMLANYRGAGIAATSALTGIQKVLDASDQDLESTLAWLDAELRSMPEAIERESGIALLKSKFGSLDEQVISSLFVDLKNGYQEARGQALWTTSYLKSRTKENREKGTRAASAESQAAEIRNSLLVLKSQLQSVVAAG
jgi:hypothetical protein